MRKKKSTLKLVPAKGTPKRVSLPDPRLSLRSSLLDVGILRQAVEEAMWNCLIDDMSFSPREAKKQMSFLKKTGAVDSALQKVLNGWFGEGRPA